MGQRVAQTPPGLGFRRSLVTYRRHRESIGKMTRSTYLGEQDLALAFHALFDFVATAPASGERDSDAPSFTYLLTPKQMSEINARCKSEGWPPITCRGIPISPNAIRHALQARSGKDQLTEAEVRKIMIAAYSQDCTIHVNRGRDKQAVVLNARRKVQIGATAYNAMAIVQVTATTSRNYLAPVTAYHAAEAKVRAIKQH